ncbi:MAG: serine/threonine-protein phosphatase [Brevinematales bacterium]|nr:serine/threonine-protein phosphatase [Brevinematales bacterium]
MTDIFELSFEKNTEELSLKKFEPSKKIFGTISFIISSQYYVYEEEFVSSLVEKLELYPELLSITVVNEKKEPKGIIIRRELFNIITKEISEEIFLLKKVKDFIKEVREFFLYKDIFSLIDEIKADLTSPEIKYYIAIDENGSPKGTFSTRDLLLYFSKIVQLDIGTAYIVQKKIIPERIDFKLNDFELSAINKMAFGIGGDFYYFRQIQERFFFFIADIAGKGYAASLVTSLLKGISDSYDFSQGIKDFVENLNKKLFALFEGEKYLTGIFCEIQGSIIKFIDAGHSHFYVLKENRFFQVKGSKDNIPIGITEEYIVKENIVDMKELEGCIFLTDGIIEQTNYAGEEFSISRVARLVTKNKKQKPEKILETIFYELENYRKDFYQKDDWTIIYLKNKH